MVRLLDFIRRFKTYNQLVQHIRVLQENFCLSGCTRIFFRISGVRTSLYEKLSCSRIITLQFRHIFKHLNTLCSILKAQLEKLEHRLESIKNHLEQYNKQRHGKVQLDVSLIQGKKT